ncbi:MAG: RNA polymerase sigma factor [Paracoccaceae bacterium]
MSDQAKALDALHVAAALAGEGEGWAMLVRRRGPRLYAHARRLSDSHEAAQDIVQDGWIEILRGLPALRAPSAFLPWALRIVTRRAAAEVRGQIGRRRLSQELAAEPGPDPDLPAGGDEAALARAIASLPRDQAATLALFYLEDMRVAEVAVALDVPPGTVKTRLMHARQKLRAILEGEDHEIA